MSKGKRRFFFYTIFTIIVIGVLYILFNNFGLVKYVKTQSE
jgi:hypothetical protein